MVGGVGQPERKRPLLREVGLSAGFTAALVAFAAAATWAGSLFLTTENGTRAFTILVLLVVVGFLVYYAYPPRKRRVWRYAVFGLCALLVAPVVIPLVYLPWLIVTRREWRDAG